MIDQEIVDQVVIMTKPFHQRKQTVSKIRFRTLNSEVDYTCGIREDNDETVCWGQYGR